MSQLASPATPSSNLLAEDAPAFEPETLAARLWRELRTSIRGLIGSPLYSVPAVLSVALGTGASLAVFAVFSALTLRPLSFTEPGQLVSVGFRGASEWFAPGAPAMSHPLVSQFREHRSIFESITARRDLGGRLEIDGRPPLLPPAARVPLDFFDTLGVRPEQGRTFSARGATPDNLDVVVLRHGFWSKELGGAPLLGQTVLINEIPKKVIGIIPDEQALPSWAAFWDPIDLAREARPDAFYFSATARLAPGVSPTMAQERLSSLTADLDVRNPADERLSVSVSPLRETLVEAERGWLRVMLAAVLSFLLLSCANLAALLATRAAVRQRQRAVCSALGASRRLLVAQSVLEAFLLALSGSLIGLALAHLGMDLANERYADVLGNSPARIDAWVLAGLSALIMTCTVAGSAAPVLVTRQLRPMDALGSAGRASEGRTAARFRRALIAVQVAVSAMLLVAAGLLTRSLQATLASDPGFDGTGVVTANVVLAVPERDGSEESFMAQAAEGRRQVEALLAKLQTLPGVVNATVSSDLPFDYMDEQNTLELEPGAKKPTLAVGLHHVGPGHFETLGMRLISGRFFAPEEQRAWPPQRVALVSRSLARDGLGVKDATGHHLRFPTDPSVPADNWIEIIGMVENTRERSLTDVESPTLYFPFFAFPTRATNQGNVMVAVALRVSGSPEAMVDRLPGYIAEVLPRAPVPMVRTMSDWMAESYARRTALSQVLSALAVAAVALSVIGLFGMTSYSVARRAGEIGIRRALGASRRTIRRMILRETGRVVVLGLLAGLAGAWFARSLLESFLYGIEPLDPLTYGAVSAGILLATAAAALFAARPAIRIAPSRALSSG